MMNRDPLTWIVTYADGRTLAEYDADGIDHGFAEVDAAQARVLALVDDTGRTLVAVALPTDTPPVFFRRRTISIDLQGNEPGRSSATCLGWAGAYLWIYADGTLALTPSKD